jgi:hypothetical protein
MGRPGRERPTPSSETPVITPEVIMPGERRPQADSEAERTLQTLAFLTDNLFPLPGTNFRFGLDPIVGLFPVVGDLASAVVSLYIMQAAARFEVPRSTLARMSFNVAIDYLLGAIPFVGNVFDFWWKANHRNVQLLERALAAPAQKRRRNRAGDWVFIAGVILVLVAVFIGSLAMAFLIAQWVVGLFS